MAIDTARIERAVSMHSAALLAYLVRRTDPVDDAADLLGETLLIVWRKASSMPQAEEEIRPWMFGVARNVLKHHYRGAVRRRAISDRLRSMLAIAEAPGFSRVDDHTDLHVALRQLPAIDRDIVGLVHWEGFTLVEVATTLRMKDATVRSRYHRAKATLRELLASDDPPDPAWAHIGVQGAGRS